MHAITGEASGELVLRICLPYFRLEIVVLSCQFFFQVCFRDVVVLLLLPYYFFSKVKFF